jgi:hypothetical protein
VRNFNANFLSCKNFVGEKFFRLKIQEEIWDKNFVDENPRKIVE